MDLLGAWADLEKALGDPGLFDSKRTLWSFFDLTNDRLIEALKA